MDEMLEATEELEKLEEETYSSPKKGGMLRSEYARGETVQMTSEAWRKTFAKRCGEDWDPEKIWYAEILGKSSDYDRAYYLHTVGDYTDCLLADYFVGAKDPLKSRPKYATGAQVLISDGTSIPSYGGNPNKSKPSFGFGTVEAGYVGQLTKILEAFYIRTEDPANNHWIYRTTASRKLWFDERGLRPAKIFHVWLCPKTKKAKEKISMTVGTTLKALKNRQDIINTTQLGLVSTVVLEMGYDIVLHRDGLEDLQIVMGTPYEGGTVQKGDNLVKLLIGGKFGKLL